MECLDSVTAHWCVDVPDSNWGLQSAGYSGQERAEVAHLAIVYDHTLRILINDAITIDEHCLGDLGLSKRHGGRSYFHAQPNLSCLPARLL